MFAYSTCPPALAATAIVIALGACSQRRGLWRARSIRSACICAGSGLSAVIGSYESHPRDPEFADRDFVFIIASYDIVPRQLRAKGHQHD